MTEFLKQIVIDSGAPPEVMDELWFNMFCQNFAHVIISEMEKELGITVDISTMQ